MEPAVQLELDFSRRRPPAKRRFGYDVYRGSGLVPYNPRECRRRLLELIGDDWVGAIRMFRDVNMPVQAVDHMLDLLVRWGRLERHALYFGPHTSPDRLTRPPMNPKTKYAEYQGFEFGYRRKNTGLSGER
jgi:hypothetical protein